jgi:DNA-binding transcriptional MerR regulator
MRQNTTFTIGELVRELGLPAETIRYYEREGLLPSPERSAGNYRHYTDVHRERLAFIRNCRSLDMTRGSARAADREGRAGSELRRSECLDRLSYRSCGRANRGAAALEPTAACASRSMHHNPTRAGLRNPEEAIRSRIAGLKACTPNARRLKRSFHTSRSNGSRLIRHGGVTGFRIDPSLGTLQILPGAPYGVYADNRVTVDPRGEFLFLANYTCPIYDIAGYSIDPSTGSLTATWSAPYHVNAGARDIAFEPTGKYLYATGGAGIEGFQLNRPNGTLTALPGSPYPFAGEENSIALY